MIKTYEERAQVQNNPIGKKLFEIMAAKKTNLAISADVTTKAELISIADTLGPKMCILKMHFDILTDADVALIETLKKLSEQHQFLIFEDRKFADIGNTVRLQYEGGPFAISSWADMVNFHILPGPGILSGLKAAKGKAARGFIVLSQMSSADNLFTPEYSKAARCLAQANPDEVFGFICVNKQSDDPRFVHMTPGVKISRATDGLGQQYRSPEVAIVEQGCDVIIVGRGIIQADDMLATAESYRDAGWRAYHKTLKSR